MSNSIAPGSSADVNVRVTALTTNPNVPVTYKIIILKKNLVNGVNTLTQEMMSAQNTKYVIKYDYVLGEDITVPNGCILEFEGGSVSSTIGYEITFSNTFIIANTVVFNCFTKGTVANNIIYGKWFGIIEGCVNKTETFFKIFNISQDNKVFDFCNVTFDISNNTSSGVKIIGNNVVIRNLICVLHNTNPLFEIGTTNNNIPSYNIRIEHCSFTSSDNNTKQIILLYSVNKVYIDNNIFVHVGYCVIQQKDYSSNNVFVTNNVVKEATKDFIECNCEADAPSQNWFIENNIYEGCIDYPDWGDTEQRFIGITSVENIHIVCNKVKKTCADSMIHIEDSYGDILINENIFENAVGYFIFVMSPNCKHLSIGCNIFKITDILCCNKGSYGTTQGTPYFYAYHGDTYSPIDVIIHDNIFEGLVDTTHNCGKIDAHRLILENNIFSNIGEIVERDYTKLINNVFRGSMQILSRPTLEITDKGYEFFDTTLNKPIWWTGSAWVDATGATV